MRPRTEGSRHRTGNVFRDFTSLPHASKAAVRHMLSHSRMQFNAHIRNFSIR